MKSMRTYKCLIAVLIVPFQLLHARIIFENKTLISEEVNDFFFTL